MIPDEVRLNTLVDAPRLYMIKDLLSNTAHLSGDLVEVGVYKGGTARFIRLNSNKKLFLFDTFTGMPAVKPVDIHEEGDFADTSIEHVDALLMPYSNYSIYKGVFPRVNTEYIAHKTFSFVHLDVDIYDSVKECLEFFYPRMTLGSVIVLDDYNEVDCPGAKLAADEFFAGKTQKVVATVQSQAIIQF